MRQFLIYSTMSLFIQFLYSVSNADPTLYYVEKFDHRIKRCYIESMTEGSINYCLSVYQKKNIRPNAIVISADGRKAFLSASIHKVPESGIVESCDRNRDGKLDNCKSLNYKFNNPRGMALDSNGRLYITESSVHKVTICTSPEYPDAGGDCEQVSPIFHGSPTSIALTKNGNIAYISQPDINTLTYCEIDKHDPYRKFKNCIDQTGIMFKNINSLTIGPNGDLYTLNIKKYLDGQRYHGYVCKLTDLGHIYMCYGSKVFEDDSGTSIALSPYQDPAEPDVAYGFVAKTHSLHLCKITYRPYSPFECQRYSQDTTFRYEGDISYLFIQP